VGRSVFRRPRGWDLAGLAFGKVFFIVWAIVIPLTQHPLIELIPVLLTVSAVASLALTVTFQLSHCLEEAITLAPVESSAKAEWHIHQVEATADFAQRNPFLRWYLGGLNHQIEHHLFPRVPHTLHAQLARIVSSTAVEYGVTYNAHPSVNSALRSHTRWLKQMGAAPVV